MGIEVQRDLIEVLIHGHDKVIQLGFCRMGLTKSPMSCVQYQYFKYVIGLLDTSKYSSAYRIVSYSAMPAPAAALCWRKMNIVMRVATKVPPPVMKTVMRMIRRMRKREIRHLDQPETTKKKQTASIK